MIQNNRWRIETKAGMGPGFRTIDNTTGETFLTRLGHVTLAAVIVIILTGLIIGGMMCAPSPQPAHAEETYSDEQIVNAIYHAEGGAKATFAYGIRSVPYRDIQDARRICFNSVRNNRKRFAKQTRYTDYLTFLASRYCPIGAANDPRGLNKNWLSNVRYFLERGA